MKSVAGVVDVYVAIGILEGNIEDSVAVIVNIIPKRSVGGIAIARQNFIKSAIAQESVSRPIDHYLTARVSINPVSDTIAIIVSSEIVSG